MSTTIVSTLYLLPQAVIGNGVTTGTDFTNTDNLLYVDTELSESATGDNQASDVIVGNYNVSLPQDATITGIRLKLFAKRNGQTTPPISVTPVLVDNLTGTNVYYPGSEYTALTTDLEEHILGGQTDLWGNSNWTPDEINNIKVQLVANGSIEVDSVLVQVFYYTTPTPTPPSPSGTSCEDCNSTIEALPFVLARTMLSTDTTFQLKSFNLVDGSPITLAMLGACGGEITITFDKGKPKLPGTNFQEDAVITSVDGVITILPNGYVEIDLGDITNRGLMPITPYTHDADLLSEHNVGTQVIISNSGRYQDRFLQKCHVGTLVSLPITTQDEGDDVVYPTETLNFIGDNVQAEQDSIDPTKANITFVSNPTNVTPTVVHTSSGTNNATPSLTLTVSHVISTENYLRVGISTENETISGVTYDGVAMSLVASETDAGNDIKVAIYDLINPNAGTNDIVVTMANASIITAIGTSYDDVDTSNPVDGISAGATGNSTSPSDTVTTTVQNTVVQDIVGTKLNPTIFAQSGLWTIQGDETVSGRPGACSTRKVLIPQAVTDTYTLTTATNWVIIMAGVRGNTAPVITGQIGIQFQDEGVNLGSSGTVDQVDFTGTGVTATRVGNTLTVDVPAGGGGTVQSVTGLDTDNTDPANPIVQISVDGVTITGDGTPGNPLVSVGGGGTSSQITIQDEFIGGTDAFGYDTTGALTDEGLGELGWLTWASVNGGFGVNIDGEANHPGIAQMQKGNVNKSIYLNPSLTMVNNSIYRYIFRQVNSTSNIDYTVGLEADGTTSQGPNRITLRTQAGVTDFITSNNANVTQTTSLTPITNGQWVEMLIKVTTGATVVECWIGINGATPTLVASHSTNVPSTSVATSPVFFLLADANPGTGNLDIDYFSMYDPTANAVVGGGGGGSTITMTANEDLTIGQTVGVSVFGDGKVARANRGTQTITTGITDTVSYNYQGKQCAIGGNKTVYLSSDSGGIISAIVAETNYNTLSTTVGTAVTVIATNNLVNNATVAKLDTDKFIVFYTKSASTTIVYYKVGTVAGNVITLSAEATFVTASSAINLRNFVSIQTGTDAGAMMYSCATTTDSACVGYTVSGTTATAGTPASLGTNLKDLQDRAMEQIGSNKFVIVASGSGSVCYGQVGTISGANVTLGAEATISTSQGLDDVMGIYSKATDQFVYTFKKTGGSYTETVACTVSGTTFTAGAELENANVGNSSLLYDGTNYILKTAGGGTQNMHLLALSGTTLTTTSSIAYNGTAFANLVGYGLRLTGGWISGSIGGTTLSVLLQGQSNSFMGIAQATVAKGATVSVLYSGKDTNQTGLSAGGLYVPNGTGGLSNVSSSNAMLGYQSPVVKALNPTTVIL